MICIATRTELRNSRSSVWDYCVTHAAEAVSEGFRFDAEAWRDEANKLKDAPAALIVRQPSGSACHHSSQDNDRRLLETR